MGWRVLAILCGFFLFVCKEGDAVTLPLTRSDGAVFPVYLEGVVAGTRLPFFALENNPPAVKLNGTADVTLDALGLTATVQVTLSLSDPLEFHTTVGVFNTPLTLIVDSASWAFPAVQVPVGTSVIVGGNQVTARVTGSVNLGGSVLAFDRTDATCFNGSCFLGVMDVFPSDLPGGVDLRDANLPFWQLLPSIGSVQGVEMRFGNCTICGFVPGYDLVRFTAACDDGRDNDSDGLTDFPADPGCASARDLDEHSPTLACDDGADNDGDTLVDYPADPGCQSAASVRENPQCQDGLNNDSQVGIDFDGGASVNGGVPIADPDPQCVGKPWLDREVAACGLGAELALLMPLLGLAASRRRRANWSNPAPA